jgi:16S rRNA (cytosine967-C5)-methyltransferase
VTPAARVQAAIEILDAVVAAAREGGAAADTIVSRYFSTRRYAGAKDRRAVRELVYRAVRRSAKPPPGGRAAMLKLAASDPQLLSRFDGSAHGPAPVGADEPADPAGDSIVPSWLAGRLDPLVDAEEWPDLLGRAPLDLRVNLLKGNREQALAALPEAEPTLLSPIGLRLPDGFRVEASEAWPAGLIEIQDEGSQLVALACSAEPAMLVLDLCAGTGGKTLALAAQMANRGRLVAADTDRARLARMRARLDRAGASIVESRLLDPGRERPALADLDGAADLVLVDAPCSGSGTWRRNPELRWRLTEKRLEALVALQARLLDLGGALLRPGGILVYAVCSLLCAEGREQAEAWSARSSLVSQDLPIKGGRAAGRGRLLTPGRDGTDGFFVARWRAPC